MQMERSMSCAERREREMQMERSMSCAERSTTYGSGAAPDLRCYSASYAPRVPPSSSNKVKRARSTTSSWTRPVHRSGSVRSVAAPPAGLNLRCYSASYAASYGPTADAGAGAAGGGGELKRSGSVTNWSASNHRSVNLRGYTPSFSALDSTATVAPVPAPAKKATAVDDAAEVQRKKRLVVYKVYDVEGKVRDSVRQSVSWIKGKCSRVVYGWW